MLLGLQMKPLRSVAIGRITRMPVFASSKQNQHGFTLIELIMVIVITGILAAVIAPIVMKPFLAYDNASRRVALVDAAEAAMRKITRDVREAVPNTLRTNGSVIEFMPIQGGGRYRYGELTGVVSADDKTLTPGVVDTKFETLGSLNSMPSAARMIVYNTGATSFYAAATSGGAGIITPTSTTLSLTDNGNEDLITLSSGFQFDLSGNGSPQKRFFLATSPVTYHCDTSVGNIVRFENYSTAVSQPTSRASTPLSGASSSAILVSNVSNCSFIYTQGTSSRAALLTMDISLTIEGETIKVLHQVHIRNAP